MARAFPPNGSANPWEVLAEMRADAALLQECRREGSEFLNGEFHYMPTRWGWGTGIWSRWKLEESGAFPRWLKGEWPRYQAALDGYVAAATVVAPSGLRFTVVSVHAYPAMVREEYLASFDVGQLRLPHAKGIWPADLIWWALCDHTSALAPAIVAGDWNTARRFDVVYGPRGNAEFFARMADAGWVELARRFHPEEVRTFWKHRRGPYQLDHVFTTEDIADGATAFDIVATDAVLATSDHAALVVEFPEHLSGSPSPDQAPRMKL